LPEPFKTPLQDYIDYKANVIAKLVSSKEVVGLLLDDPNVDMESEETYTALDACIFDFDYIDKMVERSDAFIMVDADMISPASASFNTWELYVQIVCHKDYVPLKSRIFKGVKGNRRDNLICEVDKLLNGSHLFGIGQLNLISLTSSLVPDAFTSKMLTYQIKETRRERYDGKY